MDKDMLEEIRQDEILEAKRDAAEDQHLREDFDYAVEQLGIYEVTEALEEVQKRLSEYGWEVSTKELLGYV